MNVLKIDYGFLSFESVIACFDSFRSVQVREIKYNVIRFGREFRIEHIVYTVSAGGKTTFTCAWSFCASRGILFCVRSTCYVKLTILFSSAASWIWPRVRRRRSIRLTFSFGRLSKINVTPVVECPLYKRTTMTFSQTNKMHPTALTTK